VKETSDPNRGRFGAEFAAELRGQVFDLPDHEAGLLYRACSGHTHERTHPDIAIQTCWDADRLDLGRVGVTPSSVSSQVPSKSIFDIPCSHHDAIGSGSPRAKAASRVIRGSALPSVEFILPYFQETVSPFALTARPSFRFCLASSTGCVPPSSCPTDGKAVPRMLFVRGATSCGSSPVGSRESAPLAILVHRIVWRTTRRFVDACPCPRAFPDRR
jgi:hypothetical protein